MVVFAFLDHSLDIIGLVALLWHSFKLGRWIYRRNHHTA